MERQLGSKSSCLSVWERTPGVGGESLCWKGAGAGGWAVVGSHKISLHCSSLWKRPSVELRFLKVEPRSTWPGFIFWGVKNEDSGAAPQTYWVRISGGGIREPAFLISSQVILMFPKVQPPLHQRQCWLQAARLTLLQMGPTLLGSKGVCLTPLLGLVI